MSQNLFRRIDEADIPTLERMQREEGWGVGSANWDRAQTRLDYLRAERRQRQQMRVAKSSVVVAIVLALPFFALIRSCRSAALRHDTPAETPTPSVTTPTTRAAPGPETTQWANTRWGMTDQQILDLYPKAVRNDESRCNLKLLSFTIAGELFDVHFCFDSAGGLEEVILMKDAKQSSEITPARDKLEALLDQKYGTPSLRDTTGNNGRLRVIWTTPAMTITLYYWPVATLDLYYLQVYYIRPDSDALSHL